MMRLLSALVLAGVLAPAAAEVPIESFFKHSEFRDIQLSPDGKYLAATVPDEETQALVVMELATRKVTGAARFSDSRQVGSFAWASNTRLAFTISDRAGGLVAPVRRGELLFMDVRGRDRASYAGGSRSSVLTNPLLDDDQHVIVTDYLPGNRREEADTVLYRVNARTARGSVVAYSPVPNARFLVDNDGSPRVAAGGRGFRRGEVHYYDADQSSWRLIYEQAKSEHDLTPIAMHPDGVRFYALRTESEGPSGIYLVDPVGTMELVVNDAVSDPGGFVESLDGRELIAVDFLAATPRREYVNPQHPDARLLAGLEQAFPNQWVNLVSGTKDGRLAVFLVTSDRDPGQFYLFDRESGRATYLASRADWIKADQMAQMRPVKFTARDGLTIHGWLTLPNGVEPRGLPLIVNPHGGPHGPYDRWGFNADVQLLASRGYAVLQPNFRGSGGFGRAFEEAGYREWGGTMQDDVTDATLWAIEQGIADPERICLYGASYGAYASLMGVAKEPRLYRCAMGFVGVYDLEMMYRRGDIRESSSGNEYLEHVLSRSSAELAARSPAQLVDRIEVPIMIVAGGRDRRTPPAQSELLVAQMKKAGKEHLVEEFWVERGEGHGFYKVENNVRLFSTMLRFFDRHIGEGRSSAATAAN